MRINDTIPDFLQLFKTHPPVNLEGYYEKHAHVFKTYFGGYCNKTHEKLLSAKERYEVDSNKINKIYQMLPNIIDKVARKGESYFGFSLDKPIHLFVGLYASNAFVDHQAQMYLAIEKLPEEQELLEIIVTHEMIHSYHYHILGRGGIDWRAIDWQDVRNSIYLEGVATYLSKKLVPGHPISSYFSYDYNGDEWLTFCKNHLREIANALLKDLRSQRSNLAREWLKLSGGEHFGYSRLGYFLGTEFVNRLCKELSEDEVLKLLATDKVSIRMDEWIREVVEKNT